MSVSMALGHKRGTNPPAALQLRAAACLESMTRSDPDVSVLWPICSSCGYFCNAFPPAVVPGWAQVQLDQI